MNAHRAVVSLVFLACALALSAEDQPVKLPRPWFGLQEQHDGAPRILDLQCVIPQGAQSAPVLQLEPMVIDEAFKQRLLENCVQMQPTKWWTEGNFEICTDGVGRASFDKGQPGYMSFGWRLPSCQAKDAISPDRARVIAANFLKSRLVSLGIAEYIPGPIMNTRDPNVALAFEATVQGARVNGCWVEIRVDPDGRVCGVSLYLRRWKEIGRYPIISAEEALAEFRAGHGESYQVDGVCKVKLIELRYDCAGQPRGQKYMEPVWRIDFMKGESHESTGYVPAVRPEHLLDNTWDPPKGS